MSRTRPKTGEPHELWWTDDEVESDVDWLDGGYATTGTGSYTTGNKNWCGNFRWYICPPKPLVATGLDANGAQQIGSARTTCCTDEKECEDEWDAANFVVNELAVSPRDSGLVRNDITMDKSKEMVGPGTNNIPDPWWYNRNMTDDIDNDEVGGHLPSPMYIYSKDTRLSDYW